MLKNNVKIKSGFTLIEILVVIAIIAFLAAILTTVVGTMVGTARVKATRSTIKKVSGMLQRRMDAFERAIKIQNDKSTPDYAVSWLSTAGGNIETAKVYGRKALFRTQFSQRFSEMDTPPSYDITKHLAATESSEVMYYFLTQMESFGAPPVESDSFIASELQETDGDGLMEIVDAWGNPLRFYRWPTRLVKPDGATIDLNSGAISLLSKALPSRATAALLTNPLNQDPDDPTGYIQAEITALNTTAADFETDFHTHDTWHSPLVVSMGPDEILGLKEPNDSTVIGRLAEPVAGETEKIFDNISNMNLESGSN